MLVICIVAMIKSHVQLKLKLRSKQNLKCKVSCLVPWKKSTWIKWKDNWWLPPSARWIFQWGEQRQHLVLVLIHPEPRGKERVWVLPGQVLDTAALLTEGQLSAHVCRAHIRQLTQFCASGWHVCNLVGHLMKLHKPSLLVPIKQSQATRNT